MPETDSAPLRVLVAGTPEVAVPVLEAVADSRHELVGVLTRPDAPRGRRRVLTPSPVAARAEQLGVETVKAARLRGDGSASAVERLREITPDVVLVVAYGALVPADLLRLPRLGWLNLHFSALPAYRGAAPVQHAVMSGEESIDAVVFQIEQGLDTGPVFGRVSRPIAPGETAGEILTDLAVAGAPLCTRVLDELADGTAQATPQVGEPSHAPKLTHLDGLIDPSGEAHRVAAHVNGVTPEPGAWGWLATDAPDAEPTRFTLVGAHPVGEDELPDSVRSAATGALEVAAARTWLRTGTGALRLDRVKAAGKKLMPARDWANGRPAGARLLCGEELADRRGATDGAATDGPSEETRRA